MADTPSSILLLRLQSTGSNTNLWGGYLNTALQTLERSAKGYQALAVTGDATISWTNYSASNDGAVASLKLTGSLTAAAALTFPSLQSLGHFWNAAGQAVTIKCSGGTGVSIANGARALLYCDGTDYYNIAPTIFPAAITVSGGATFSGILSGVTAGLANTDATNVAQVAAAIAAAGTLTPATVRVSINDTTAGYLGSKIAVAGDLSLSTQNPGADEDALITATPYWSAPRSLAFADSPITALDRDVLLISTAGGAVTVNLPASGRVIVVDRSGNAATNNITLTPAGADTVTFGTIDTNYFASAYRRNGTNWDLAE
jgi:hypothetical protein